MLRVSSRLASAAPLLTAALGLALSAGVGLELVGCSAFETNLQDTAIDLKDTARQNFESAENAFKARRFNEAVKYFEVVKNKFPYSKYAVLAELRLADTHFEREKWLEAADAYRIFVRFHPRHEEVAYAMYRVALAHSRAIENNIAWVPFVDAREKDQSSARDTIRACDEFTQHFPNDPRAEEIKKLRVVARGRLADVDLYAAAFYEERERWQGAVWRYLRVGEEFADTEKAAWALLKAGTLTAKHLDDKDSARAIFAKIVRQFPTSKEAGEARAATAKL